MRKIILLYPTILLGLIFGIGLTFDSHNESEYRVTQLATIKELNPTTEISPIDIVLEMLGQVNQDRALTDLRRITGEEPICTDDGCYTITNRLTGSEGLQWAKDYIYKELVSLGYSVELQDWSSSGYADQNLITRKLGMVSPDEEIYFVAHMDGVKKGLLGQSPAADDNASGVVDLLELARVLSGHSLSRTVVFLFSTGEEEGALGARSYVDQLTDGALSTIKYVVNIDMIGYDENGDGMMQLWPGEHAPSRALTEVMSDTIQAYQLNLLPRIITGCD